MGGSTVICVCVDVGRHILRTNRSSERFVCSERVLMLMWQGGRRAAVNRARRRMQPATHPPECVEAAQLRRRASPGRQSACGRLARVQPSVGPVQRQRPRSRLRSCRRRPRALLLPSARPPTPPPPQGLPPHCSMWLCHLQSPVAAGQHKERVGPVPVWPARLSAPGFHRAAEASSHRRRGPLSKSSITLAPNIGVAGRRRARGALPRAPARA
jgi:hypothetical protein